jgi:hypothetical protein
MSPAASLCNVILIRFRDEATAYRRLAKIPPTMLPFPSFIGEMLDVTRIQRLANWRRLAEERGEDWVFVKSADVNPHRPPTEVPPEPVEVDCAATIVSPF